jgi:hypothetical protein
MFISTTEKFLGGKILSTKEIGDHQGKSGLG